MKNPWSDRWIFVKDYVPQNASIVDFGCGNREALDYIKPTRYYGIDLTPDADLVADLNQPLLLSEKFDAALLLGVLEYVDDPSRTLDNIATAADTFIVLSLLVNKKPQWKQAFTEPSITQLLSKYFQTVSNHRHGRYLLSVCKK